MENERIGTKPRNQSSYSPFLSVRFQVKLWKKLPTLVWLKPFFFFPICSFLFLWWNHEKQTGETAENLFHSALITPPCCSHGMYNHSPAGWGRAVLFPHSWSNPRCATAHTEQLQWKSKSLLKHLFPIQIKWKAGYPLSIYPVLKMGATGLWLFQLPSQQL